MKAIAFYDNAGKAGIKELAEYDAANYAAARRAVAREVTAMLRRGESGKIKLTAPVIKRGVTVGTRNVVVNVDFSGVYR